MNIVNYDDYITPEIEKRQKDLNWGEAPPPPPPGQRGGGAAAVAVVAVAAGAAASSGRRWARSAGTGARRSSCRSSIRRRSTSARITCSRPAIAATTGASISPDLTKNDIEKTLRKSGGLTPDEDPGGGAEFYGTIVTRHGIADEPGRDLGRHRRRQRPGDAQRRRDVGRGGQEHQDCPATTCMSAASSRRTTRAAPRTSSIDGHEAAIFKPFVFKTTDYGKTWTSISANLPDGGPVYVVKEDLKNPEPAVRRHRVRDLLLDRRREEVGAPEQQPADGVDPGHRDPSARQRPDRRDDGARALDHG